jgi:hypothetical protein
MKKFKLLLSVMFLLLTLNSFGEHDHEDFEGAHAFPFSIIIIILGSL